MEFFEILWRDDPMDMTVVSTDSFHLDEIAAGRLKITFRGKSVVMGKERSLVHLGRGEHNDLQVVRPFVSKRHATIELRDGGYVLTDTASTAPT